MPKRFRETRCAMAALAIAAGWALPVAAHPPVTARPALRATAPTVVRSEAGPGVALRWDAGRKGRIFRIYRDQVLIAPRVAGAAFIDWSAEYGHTYEYTIATTLPDGKRITSASYLVTVTTSKPRRPAAAIARR